MPIPSCFDSAESYNTWLNYAGRYRADNFCTDCTPAYQAEMVAAGRCAFPETAFMEVFDQFGDPERVGVRIANVI